MADVEYTELNCQHCRTPGQISIHRLTDLCLISLTESRKLHERNISKALVQAEASGFTLKELFAILGFNRGLFVVTSIKFDIKVMILEMQCSSDQVYTPLIN